MNLRRVPWDFRKENCVYRPGVERPSGDTGTVGGAMNAESFVCPMCETGDRLAFVVGDLWHSDECQATGSTGICI
jgi:hypothetical protein